MTEQELEQLEGIAAHAGVEVQIERLVHNIKVELRHQGQFIGYYGAFWQAVAAIRQQSVFPPAAEVSAKGFATTLNDVLTETRKLYWVLCADGVLYQFKNDNQLFDINSNRKVACIGRHDCELGRRLLNQAIHLKQG